ncbi:MAG: hypothetical protein ABSH40_12745 [Bryobacteraceae bacterium]
MKFATFALLAIPLLGTLPAAKAADSAGASQVAVGFAGGSVWTSASTGICVWYFPVIGDLTTGSLFMADSSGAPVVDRAHSYLIWVSDFSVQVLPTSPGSLNFLALAPAGQATIYYSSRPDLRDWSDLTKRNTWGVPVATFVRKASLVRSADALVSDTFTFSTSLVSTETFSLGGIQFDFKDLIPNGMTCFEFGQNGSSWEAGTCHASGGTGGSRR